MQVKVILVEPKYQINLGYVARTAMNFGVKRLFFVSPRADLKGNTAIRYAKHARSLLENAKVYKNLDDATRDCDFVIATSGIWRKGKANFNKTYLAEKAIGKMEKFGDKSVIGLLIGRDDIGLRSEEVGKCDMLAFIETDPEYPVLNISHALAIMLYLAKKNTLGLHYEGIGPNDGQIDKRELGMLFDTFDRLIKKKKIRDEAAVSNAFKRMVRLAQPTKRELHAIITALK